MSEQVGFWSKFDEDVCNGCISNPLVPLSSQISWKPGLVCMAYTGSQHVALENPKGEGDGRIQRQCPPVVVREVYQSGVFAVAKGVMHNG
jgi:hypothetical protein